jgi:hypothetical protein
MDTEINIDKEFAGLIPPEEYKILQESLVHEGCHKKNLPRSPA